MQNYDEFVDLSSNDAPVRGYLHRAEPAKAGCLILTHGAGANCQAPLLVALADAFCAAGLNVLRCDLPFRQSRPHGPPHPGSAGRDQQGLRAAVAAMRKLGAGKVYLGGHSYGGRQASMLAASEPGVAGALLLLSYPLHPPKQPAKLRTDHFPKLQTPALFVHGIRDGFATTSEMEAALKIIPSRTGLLSVASAGHELMTRTNRAELIERVTSNFIAFTRPLV